MRFNPSKFKMDVDTTPHNTVYRVWKNSSVQNLDVIKLDIPFTINVQSSLNFKGLLTPFFPLPKYEKKQHANCVLDIHVEANWEKSSVPVKKSRNVRYGQSHVESHFQ